jgi:hypothetical protein
MLTRRTYVSPLARKNIPVGTIILSHISYLQSLKKRISISTISLFNQFNPTTSHTPTNKSHPKRALNSYWQSPPKPGKSSPTRTHHSHQLAHSRSRRRNHESSREVEGSRSLRSGREWNFKRNFNRRDGGLHVD